MNPTEPKKRIPKALHKHPNYENFSAQCPYPDCAKWNIYNRASDLRTFELISNMEVTCQNPQCGRPFTIGGDLVNPAWQMLISDCEVLKGEKRYAYCVLNLAQAFEVFFSLYFRVELLYRPFVRDGNHDIERLNRLFILLYSSVKDYTFGPMCSAFISSVLRRQNYSSLMEAEDAMSQALSCPKMPSDERIRSYPDSGLASLLLELKDTKVPSLRNNVVHKHAYRPTVDEVEQCIKETAHLLYGLDSKLGTLVDDINWYYGHANGN